MIKIIAFLALLLISPAQSLAEFNGLSAFSSRASRYPCTRALEIVSQSKQPALAILYGTNWGGDNDYDCAKQFLSAVHGPKLLEIHFSNEVARRNKTLSSGDFFPQDSVKRYNQRLQAMDGTTLTAIASRVKEIREKFAPLCASDCQLMLSTGLEDNYTAEAYKNLSDAITLEWPYLIARSPCKGTKNVFPGQFKETHSRTARMRTLCIANEDGNQNPTLDKTKKFFKQHKNCYARFIWRPKHQGNYGGKFVPREKRKLKIPATDVKQLGRLLAAQ